MDGVTHKAITIFLDPALHNSMKELSKRRRIHIGKLYEEALEMFLDSINNYMGKQNANPQKKVVKK